MIFTEWVIQNGEQIFDEAFQKKYIEQGRRGIGSDGVSLDEFRKIYEQEKRSILRKLGNGTYEFSPFLRTEKKEAKFDPKIQQWKIKSRGIIQATIRDTIAQSIILEYLMQIPPYTEFYSYSYAYQAKKSPVKAVFNLKKALKAGYIWVYDADISGFFDNIDHSLLMDMVKKYFLEDSQLCKFLERFIKTGYIFVPSFYTSPKVIKGKRIREICQRQSIGIPQGGILSGYLANLFLNQFDYKISQSGLNVRYIRYADDFIVLAKTLEDATSSKYLIEKRLLPSLNLNISPEKTCICCERSGQYTKAGFEFLGFKFQDGIIRVKEANIQKLISSISTIKIFEKSSEHRTKPTIHDIKTPVLKALSNGQTYQKGIAFYGEDWQPENRLKVYFTKLDAYLALPANDGEYDERLSWYDYFYLINDKKQIQFLDAILQNRINNLYQITYQKQCHQNILQEYGFQSFTNRFYRKVKQKLNDRKKYKIGRTTKFSGSVLMP